MIETVLGLPFLLVVLLLVFFLGRQWMRQQHAEDVAYYDAWQAAERADGPEDPGIYADDFVRTDPTLSVDASRVFSRAYTDAVERAVGNVDADAALFVQVVHGQMPAGVLREHETDYPDSGVQTTLRRWFPGNTGFSRNLRAYHLRLDQPWPHAVDQGYEHPATGSTDTLGHQDIIRDEYLAGLTDALQALPGNRVADLSHRTLGRLANYRGPAFPDE